MQHLENFQDHCLQIQRYHDKIADICLASVGRQTIQTACDICYLCDAILRQGQ